MSGSGKKAQHTPHQQTEQGKKIRRRWKKILFSGKREEKAKEDKLRVVHFSPAFLVHFHSGVVNSYLDPLSEWLKHHFLDRKEP